MLRKALFVIGILLLASALIVGGVLAQGQGGNGSAPSLSPAASPEMVSGKEVYGLEVGDGSSAETQQGQMPLLSFVTPVKTISGNDLAIGDVTSEDSPVTTIGNLEMADLVPDANTPTSEDVLVDGHSVLTEPGEKPSQTQSLGPKGEAGILATYSINGALTSGASHYYGPWYFSPGETVTISISWTPTSSSVDVGLQSVSTGKYYYITCTGGACSHTFQVNVGDNYYVRIRNRGPYTINYSGYITI